ncbi:hypothetical protein LCGC14_3113810 [marine sediment metagenome]|uniref:Uncharacterized protein n=1 Tax=marine sediment metagenome TaxID=412755 RepID=A0A0F8W4Q3_9ZZZZ
MLTMVLFGIRFSEIHFHILKQFFQLRSNTVISILHKINYKLHLYKTLVFYRLLLLQYTIFLPDIQPVSYCGVEPFFVWPLPFDNILYILFCFVVSFSSTYKILTDDTCINLAKSSLACCIFSITHSTAEVSAVPCGSSRTLLLQK